MGMPADEIPLGFLARLGLFLARICLSAWIGAAALFVVVGVAEVTRGGFDSSTKDALVAIRFPSYYLFGVVLVSLAGIGTWLARNSVALSRRRRGYSLVLLTLVLTLMAVDYVWIYLPLLQMVTPPGQVKSASFGTYHQASKWINLAGLVLCLSAAWLVNWPFSRRVDQSTDA